MKTIYKDFIREALEWENIKNKVSIKKNRNIKGYSVYYNNRYIGCALRLNEICEMLTIINNMITALK